MKHCLSCLLLCVSFAWAEDYSQMSTQELIAIMGYVQAGEQEEFAKELASRTPQMSKQEKQRYEQKRRELQKDQ